MLLDMILPKMDGWTVARTRHERSNTIRIIVLTAHAMSGDREKPLQAGCDEHHANPIDFEVLLTRGDEAVLRREDKGE